MSADRYHRHSLIDWFSQDDLKASSFAIVGCGAVGNEVAKNLALLGVGQIDLYDFDTIEIHNLTRSVLFRESDIGLNKAEVAAKRLKEIDNSVKVNFYPGDFWDLLSLEKAKSYNCILCCVDNFEARIKLNQLCLLTGTDFVNTGIDSKFSQVEVFPFSKGRHIGCYECNLPYSAYERVQKRYSCGWLKKISYVEKKIPTTIITSSLTGSLAASSALNLIRENSSTESTRILTNTFTGVSSVSVIEQSCMCPACSSIGDHISIVKGSARIEGKLNSLGDETIHITTSDPILVSYRCIDCTPNEQDAIKVLQKASNFDSSIATCTICGKDSVDVTIKDTFKISELLAEFGGKFLPSKYIKFDDKDRTIIVDLE